MDRQAEESVTGTGVDKQKRIGRLVAAKWAQHVCNKMIVENDRQREVGSQTGPGWDLTAQIARNSSSRWSDAPPTNERASERGDEGTKRPHTLSSAYGRRIDAI